MASGKEIQASSLQPRLLLEDVLEPSFSSRDDECGQSPSGGSGVSLLEKDEFPVEIIPSEGGKGSEMEAWVKEDTNSAHQIGQTSSADEADDSTCAICLKRIPLEETAQLPGCEHVYCNCCILHWATFKEKTCCPQCKQPFTNLVTYRTLDGQYRESPAFESVALLKCSQWFRDYVKMKEQKAAANMLGMRPQGSVIDETDYVDYARYYQEFDDEEEVEDYYYSSAAGRARIVIGNRRHGPNGYMSSGRMQARPNPPQPDTAKQNRGKSHSRPSSQASSKAQSQPSAKPSSSNQTQTPGKAKKKKPSIRLDTDDESDECGPSKKNHSVGRRARRNQKKAAADARLLS